MGFYVNVEPGVNVFVEDINPAGKNTILFIHGWPGNHNLFEYQYNQLPKMGFRCVGVDTAVSGNPTGLFPATITTGCPTTCAG